MEHSLPSWQSNTVQTLSLWMLTKCSVCQWGMCAFIELRCSCLWNALVVLCTLLLFKFFKLSHFCFTSTPCNYQTDLLHKQWGWCYLNLLFLKCKHDYSKEGGIVLIHMLQCWETKPLQLSLMSSSKATITLKCVPCSMIYSITCMHAHSASVLASQPPVSIWSGCKN